MSYLFSAPKNNSLFLIRLLLILSIFAFFAGTVEAKTVKRGTQATAIELAWTIVGGSGTCNGTTGYPILADNISTNWVTSHSNAASPLSLGTSVLAVPGTYTFTCTDAMSLASGFDTLVVTDCLVGEAWNGTTCVVSAVPTLASPTQGSVTDTTADLGATITSDGGSPITARGTCYDTTANPVANCVADGGTGTGAFTQPRTGLTCGTTYYFRGYATNSNGTAYTADSTFTTNACPVVPTINAFNVPASVVSGTSPTLAWTVTGATSCSISPSVGAIAPTASGTVAAPAITATTTYTLSCVNGSSAPATASETVGISPVPAPLVTSFTTSGPVSVPSGTSPTLAWSVSGATYCEIDNGIGSVTPVAGGTVVAPAITVDTMYTLSCWNGASGPTTSNHLVQVDDPNLTVNAYTFPSGTITIGTPETLRGTVRNVGNIGSAPAFSNNFSYSYTGGAPWTDLGLIGYPAGLAANTTAAEDTQAFNPSVAGTIYFQYCVDSSNQVAEGAGEIPNCVQSGPVSVQIAAPTTPGNPPPLGNPPLTASTGACGGRIDLSWGPSTGAASYEVSVDNGATWPYTGILTSAYTINGLTPGATYNNILVRARNTTGISADAGPVSVAASPICSGLTGLGCTIADEASSCSGLVSWDVTGAAVPEVRNTTTAALISNLLLGTNVAVTLSQGVNTIESRDGGTLLNSIGITGSCGASSFFHSSLGVCKARPSVSITPNLVLIRSGQTAALNFSVNSPYPLNCTFSGGMTLAAPVVHPGAAGPTNYARTTDILSAGQVVRITCNTPANDMIPPYTNDVKVNVLPAVQEI